LTDSSSLTRIIQQVKPTEIYNLAAQSHVAVSFEEPEYTANSASIPVIRARQRWRPYWETPPRPGKNSA
jgi:GDPmannose 4,6-dehydratase